SGYIPPEDIEKGYQDLKDVVENGDPYYNPNLSLAVKTPTLRRSWEEDPSERLSKIVRAARLKDRR
ncbi:MAG TPA: hypothetical protein VF813_08140, partial [Anaerolineaceae bacterium]